MSSPRRLRPPALLGDAGYPTLREHLRSRRAFLRTGGTLAAGGLLGACGLSLGLQPGSDGGPAEDAGPRPDAGSPGGDSGAADGGERLPGGEQWPSYLTLRIPEAEDLEVPLMTYGTLIGHVDAATAVPAAWEALREHALRARQTCESVIAACTYEELISPAGLSSVETRLREALDELVMELEDRADPTLHAAVLHIARFEQSQLVGVMRKAAWP